MVLVVLVRRIARRSGSASLRTPASRAPSSPPRANTGSYERRVQLVELRHRFGTCDARRDDRAGDVAEADSLAERQPAHDRVAERRRERIAGAEAVDDLDGD